MIDGRKIEVGRRGEKKRVEQICCMKTDPYFNHSRSTKPHLVVVHQEGVAFAPGEAPLTAAAATAATTAVLSVASAMEVPPSPVQPPRQSSEVAEVTPGRL